ncbi:MAG: DUF1385 domain-containing protein [Actinobacteria bacterium]|nr:DUF1385 domain-containing protein [Actinomycetota bacterium]
MRGPKKWALAVRRPNGEIFITVDPAKTIAQNHPKWNVFPFRGLLALADSLIIGVKALSLSANIALEEEETAEKDRSRKKKNALTGTTGKPAGEDKPGAVDDPGPVPSEDKEKVSGHDGVKETITRVEMGVSIAIALVVFVGIFIAVPTVIARLLDPYIHNTVVYNLVEGCLRIGIFVVYLLLITRMPDIRRVFEYHGAEHKVVNAYEQGITLYPGSVIGFTTAHPRCGTSFILIVLVISVVIFSFFGRPALWLRILERVAIIPLVAAISYEIIRMAGKYEHSRILHVLVTPGLWLQKITTSEPDKDQIEVAISALNAALED